MNKKNFVIAVCFLIFFSGCSSSIDAMPEGADTSVTGEPTETTSDFYTCNRYYDGVELTWEIFDTWDAFEVSYGNIQAERDSLKLDRDLGLISSEEYDSLREEINIKIHPAIWIEGIVIEKEEFEFPPDGHYYNYDISSDSYDYAFTINGLLYDGLDNSGLSVGDTVNVLTEADWVNDVLVRTRDGKIFMNGSDCATGDVL